MSFSKFIKLKIDPNRIDVAEVINKLQDAIESSISSIITVLSLQQQLVRGISFKQNVSTPVSHQLGKRPIGFFMTDTTTFVNLKRDATIDVSTNIIWLIADQNATVDLCFF
jgi:hypothetical protein